MENINKLLVPIDYSETSLNALDLAVAMSRRHEAEIRLLHVIDPNQYIFISNEGLLIDFSRESVVEAETRKLKKLAETIADENAVRCSVECRTGSVCPNIVETAAQFNTDFIVMGAHGVSGIREYFMGSDAYRVVKTAGCPVLTVPNNRKWTDFKEIVFPIRPVPGALEKYEIARKIVRKNNAHLTVLGLSDEGDQSTINALNQAVLLLKSQLGQDDINGDTLLLQTDSIAETVLQKTSDLRADLVIITADLDTTVDHFFVGPFVQQIVNHAKVPVLSIRPQPVALQQLQPVDDFFEDDQAAINATLPPIQMG